MIDALLAWYERLSVLQTWLLWTGVMLAVFLLLRRFEGGGSGSSEGFYFGGDGGDCGGD